MNVILLSFDNFKMCAFKLEMGLEGISLPLACLSVCLSACDCRQCSLIIIWKEPLQSFPSLQLRQNTCHVLPCLVMANWNKTTTLSSCCYLYNNRCTEKGVLDPFCSDHCPIFISTNFIQVRQPCYESKIWLYDRANYTLFREKLNVCDWTTDNLTVDQCVTQFANNILISADKAIPNKNVTIRPRDPPWMHNEIRKEIRLRKRLHRRAKSKNDDISWEAFKVQRNKVNNLVRSSKITHFKKLATSLQQGNLNPKQWWTVTKQFLKQNKESDISLLIQNNKHFTSPHEKSNILNEYFCMQSTVDDSHATLPPIEIPEHSLDNIVISSQDVEDVLRLLDTSKASGPDLISPKLLKEGAPVLSPHFCKLFNKSIDECSFPSEWKLANIIPVYKKGRQDGGIQL